MINMNLAKEMGLDSGNVEKIKQLHKLAEDYLNSEEELGVGNVDYTSLLCSLSYIEFRLQELWGFPQDLNYHHYSFKLKGCSCPYEDNMELLGSGLFIFNKECIVHGVVDE